MQIRDSKLNRDASPSGSNIEKGGSFWWQKIWQLKLQNKVKMFAWRMAHNSLPVRRNIARKGVKIDTVCPMCNCLDEDCGHLFFKCKRVKQCWHQMNLENIRVMLEQCRNGTEVMSTIVNLEQKLQHRILIFLWQWWLARNKANEGQKMASVSEVCSNTKFHCWSGRSSSNCPHKL